MKWCTNYKVGGGINLHSGINFISIIFPHQYQLFILSYLHTVSTQWNGFSFSISRMTFLNLKVFKTLNMWQIISMYLFIHISCSFFCISHGLGLSINGVESMLCFNQFFQTLSFLTESSFSLQTTRSWLRAYSWSRGGLYLWNTKIYTLRDKNTNKFNRLRHIQSLFISATWTLTCYLPDQD